MELQSVEVGGQDLPIFLALGRSRDHGGSGAGLGEGKALVVNSTKALMCVKT